MRLGVLSCMVWDRPSILRIESHAKKVGVGDTCPGLGFRIRVRGLEIRGGVGGVGEVGRGGGGGCCSVS